MGVKETPTNIKVYYSSMKEKTTKKKVQALEAVDTLRNNMRSIYKTLVESKDTYKTNFKINLEEYVEFMQDEYIDGVFLKVTKGLFMNRSQNYILVSELFTLYNYAKLQKDLYDLQRDIERYDKILNLSLKEYTALFKVFTNEIHKKLIIEGAGYAFGHNIGWICVNRCIIKNARPKLDYAATKKKKEQLIKEGKRLYNQEEADWCRRNGIEYNAVDYRVFVDKEYCYEIPLLGCKLPNGTKYKLDISDYRHSSVRGKSNEDLIKECKGSLDQICELQIDLRTKVTLCDTSDKILYTKFIRNENQQPSTTPKASR